MLHVVATVDLDTQAMQPFYALGNASYFGESQYNMEQWAQRYWGNNYPKLINLKQELDPKRTFWCHHCIGSELPN